MPREFPDYINPWSAAQGKRTFAGTVPMKRMQRLADLLTAETGRVGFEMNFSLDTEQRPLVDLKIDATVTLLCQASLKPYEHRVRRETLIGVVESEAETSVLPDAYEPVVVDNHRLAIAELVEEEVILGLPQIPRDPDIDPVSFSTGTKEDSVESTGSDAKASKNPFAELREQLGKLQEKT